LGESGGVGLEAVGDGEAGGIVCAGVDSRPGGQLREDILQTGLGLVEVVFCINRRDIVQDT
jgi:hypothetical protein